MRKIVDTHFKALREINPFVQQIIVFDRDEENSFHPPTDNPVFYEWKRRNIDNYLLVSTAWKRAVEKVLQNISPTTDDTSLDMYYKIIDAFFAKQRIELRKDENWQTIDAEIFATIDGKKILFEMKDCLFSQLRNSNDKIVINRETLSANMLKDEIHNDISLLFEKLETILNNASSNLS